MVNYGGWGSTQFLSGDLLQQHWNQTRDGNKATGAEESNHRHTELSFIVSCKHLRMEAGIGTALSGTIGTPHQGFLSQHFQGKGEGNNASNLKFTGGENARHLRILVFLGVRVITAGTASPFVPRPAAGLVLLQQLLPSWWSSSHLQLQLRSR